MNQQRIVVWFSCGAASAVAASLAKKTWEGFYPIEYVYCNTSKNEHKDNLRFLAEVEKWLGITIKKISNPKYDTIEEVFDKHRYMSGINGAKCTTELKKIPRFLYQLPDDIHVFGFTYDESERIFEFEKNNHDLELNWVLFQNQITKQDCYRIIKEAGIRLPYMYRQGYKNNNCIGCVKATSPGYWNKIRRDYPEIFERRMIQSREIGCRLAKYKGERIFLDQLPESAKGRWKDEVISCGPDCKPN